MELIQSRRNPLIKHIRALDRKRYRDENQQFFIEGSKIVKEAIGEKVDIEHILVSASFDWNSFKKAGAIDENTYNVVYLEDELFCYIARTKTPQGIAAIINKSSHALEDTLNPREHFIAILDEVQDPGNVGTIIRTLDCAGADGVILLNGCADPFSPKALRATMGSIFRVPVYIPQDDEKFFSHLKGLGTHIMISHLDGDGLFDWEGNYKKIALIIGNEGRGVRKELLKYASSLIKIPLLGGAESLNASVASGVIIYEIVRRRMRSESGR